MGWTKGQTKPPLYAPPKVCRKTLKYDTHANAVVRVITSALSTFLQASYRVIMFFYDKLITPGPGCLKLTTSLANVSLKFQTLISQICQHFLLKKCERLLQCKSFSHFFDKKF